MKYASKTSHLPLRLPTQAGAAGKLRFNHMFLCSYALMLLCSSTSVRALTLPDTAKLLPPETVLLIDVHDFSRLKQQFEKTDFYKLCKDPAMAAFIDDLKAKWRQKSQKRENEPLRLLADVDELPEGRVAFALLFNARTKDANEPSLLLVTQWGRNINKIKEAVHKKAKQAVEDGSHRKTEGYRGVNITTIIRRSSKPFNFCFIEDCLIVSGDMDVLKFVIAHIKGAGSPTLADDADYSATMRVVKLQNTEQINCFVNIKQIIKKTIDADTARRLVAKSRQGVKAETIIGNLGLDNVASFGCSIGLKGLATAGTHASFGKAFLKIRGQKKGITKMFEIESAPLRTPRFIPNSAYSVSFVNLNIKNAYNELGNILSSFSPQLAALMYMPLIPASSPGEPPMQIKAGIIDHLGSQIIISQSTGEPVSGDDTHGPGTSLVAVAIDNRNALEKSLSLLHSTFLAANNPDASRQLLGYTIYLVDTTFIIPAGPQRPMQIAEPLTTKKPKVAFTVTDTHLIFASESVVEQVIRALNSTENESVDSARWFNRIKSTIPSVAGLASLQNDTASGEFLWSRLRKLKKQTGRNEDTDSDIQMGIAVKPASPFPQMMFSQAGIQLFDFSLLPEFDEVKKYFGLSAFYSLSKPDGFFFEFKYLNPRQDN
ncbi:MAG: DUF3352 domain-containing protein [Planctomycetes bacterium]|nr:DUF3352 domain-containing protein [Planctomycetota bacterium]